MSGSAEIGEALDPRTAPAFPIAARDVLDDAQLRKNVRHATTVIQNKRAKVVGELADWQELREAGKAIREHTMKHWSRAWKVRVILDMNPDWSDLFDTLNA